MIMGLPGSGKSDLADELMLEREDTIHITDEDEDVESLIIDSLNNGQHVIYDSTNLSRKNRNKIIQVIPKDVHKTIVYMATPFEHVTAQNMERENPVDQAQIERMYKSTQVPIYSEGWNEIKFVHHESTLEDTFMPQFVKPLRVAILLGREGYTNEIMEFLGTYFKEFTHIFDMPQDSKHHNLSVSRHTYYVYKYIVENYKAEDDKDMEVMVWTALLHDLGKYICKAFVNHKGEETRYASFIGHELVGAQIAIHFLKRLEFDDLFIHKVATLIQFHMYLLDDKANTDKLKRRVGEDMFNKLQVLREADLSAH
jgi:putative nucleotidyltransferase with HDIG domain